MNEKTQIISPPFRMVMFIVKLIRMVMGIVLLIIAISMILLPVALLMLLIFFLDSLGFIRNGSFLDTLGPIGVVVAWYWGFKAPFMLLPIADRTREFVEVRLKGIEDRYSQKSIPPSSSILEINSLNQSESVFTNVPLEERAKNLMIKRKWDVLLLDAYLATKAFVELSQREDFEEHWNIGIKNIKGIKRSMDGSNIENGIEFLCGEIRGINFQLGYATRSLDSYFDDNACLSRLTLYMFIKDKHILTADYIETISINMHFSASSYSLFSVKKFHDHASIEPLLRAIEEGIQEQKRKSEERQRLEKQKEDEENFSF